MTLIRKTQLPHSGVEYGSAITCSVQEIKIRFQKQRGSICRKKEKKEEYLGIFIKYLLRPDVKQNICCQKKVVEWMIFEFSFAAPKLKITKLGLQEFFFLLSTQSLPVHCPLYCLTNQWIRKENGCNYWYDKPTKKGQEEEKKKTHSCQKR